MTSRCYLFVIRDYLQKSGSSLLKPSKLSKPSNSAKTTSKEGGQPAANPANQLPDASSQSDHRKSDNRTEGLSEWESSSGWGDDWGSSGQGQTKADAAKERREQRKREMEAKRAAKAGGGAMKLGARKVAKD